MRKDAALRQLIAMLTALSFICRLPSWAGAEQSALSCSSTFSHVETPSSILAQTQTSQLTTTLFLNSHEQRSVLAGDVVMFRFTPDSTDDYIFRSFPSAQTALAQMEAALIRESNEEIIAQQTPQEGFRLTAQLEQGESYRLELTMHTGGEFAVEVMLDARGRCFDNPISLPAESVRYAKTIVRARDVHYFSFTAPVSGWYSIRTEKTTGQAMLDTLGYLFDQNGAMIAVNDDILFPGDSNFMIQQELTAGEVYYVRISAFSNQTGAYRLVVTMPQEGQQLPESIELSEHNLMMDVGQSVSLNTTVHPSDALGEIVYVSSDGNVVSVEPDGTLTALKAGSAVIWAMSYNGVQDRCSVTVRPVEVTGMSFDTDSVTLRANEQKQLSPIFTPKNASIQTARYLSSDESVVQVSQSGVLTGISKGTAIVTATSADGGFTDTIEVIVQNAKPVYRALVIGEQTYAEGVRVGGKNTAQGMADMLAAQSIDGASYEVRLQLDSTRRELIEGIKEAFSDAGPTDISLFYINCHGAYENGTAYLRLHDETRITVRQLEQMLRGIEGKLIVILDFCQSGSFIGAGGEFERFTGDAQRIFAGGTALTNGKYTVITSAAADQDSYRRSFTRNDDEDSTAAIMARSLCEGAGWDIIYDRSVTLKADTNRDKLVTVQEIYEYTRRRVTHYLEGTSVTQTVYLYPQGDQTVIFGRTDTDE